MRRPSSPFRATSTSLRRQHRAGRTSLISMPPKPQNETTSASRVGDGRAAGRAPGIAAAAEGKFSCSACIRPSACRPLQRRARGSFRFFFFFFGPDRSSPSRSRRCDLPVGRAALVGCSTARALADHRCWADASPRGDGLRLAHRSAIFLDVLRATAAMGKRGRATRGIRSRYADASFGGGFSVRPLRPSGSLSVRRPHAPSSSRPPSRSAR